LPGAEWRSQPAQGDFAAPSQGGDGMTTAEAREPATGNALMSRDPCEDGVNLMRVIARGWRIK